MPEEFKSGLYNIYDNCMDNIYKILMDINSQIEKAQNKIDQEIEKIDSLQLILIKKYRKKYLGDVNLANLYKSFADSYKFIVMIEDLE